MKKIFINIFKTSYKRKWSEISFITSGFEEGGVYTWENMENSLATL